MLINKSWFLTRKHPTMTKDSIVTKIQDFVFQHRNVSGFILRLKVFRMKKLRTSDEVFQFKFYPRNSAESTEKIFSDYSLKSLSILSLHRRCSKVLWRKQAENWVQQKMYKYEMPMECKPCEGATSNKNIKAADGSGNGKKSTNAHNYSCNKSWKDHIRVTEFREWSSMEVS